MVFYSSLSREELFCRMNLYTQKACIGDTGAKKVTLWKKKHYIELTWPSFIGQTSFCGFVTELDGKAAITGRFMPNHYVWMQVLLMFAVFPPIVYWISGGASMPVFLSVLSLAIGTALHFAFAPDIGKKGNEIVERFILETLCTPS